VSARVLLGIASAGQPTAPFLESLGRLELPASVEPLQRSVAVGNFIPAQRELIMEDAIAQGFDYLFFVDDDIVLPANALELLLQTAAADPNAAVIGGLYYSRDSARPIAVADWNSDDTSTAHIPGFTTQSAAEVAGVGFGCALLRVAAARTLTAPYFPAHIYIERSAHRVRQCDEDYLYCERVRKAGFTVRLDARVRCDHYDRASDSSAPLRWEDDAETAQPRMIVADGGATRIVPFDPAVGRVTETHARADVVYITVE
jgi:hypothetical protein